MKIYIFKQKCIDNPRYQHITASNTMNAAIQLLSLNRLLSTNQVSEVVCELESEDE